MIISVLTFLGGVILLYIGAEGLVRGSINIARSVGIKPVVIGLTVVAFGTSTPEFIVSLISALRGVSEIALGNVVGSNIANIGLILGIAACIRPIDVDTNSLRIYYPVLLISSILLYIFALSDFISFYHGIFLLAFIIVFTWYVIRQMSRELEATQQFASGESGNVRRFPMKLSYIIFVIFGSLLLLAGSQLMVDSGVTIARTLGVSEFVIGITLVAIGTSLPELAATIVAVIKKNTGIILGNIIGSNIFNVLFVAGGVATIHPISVDASSRYYEFPVMIGFSIILFIFMRTGFIVRRVEGFVFLLGYLIFLGFLF